MSTIVKLSLHGNGKPFKVGGGMYVVYELWADGAPGYPYFQTVLSLN